MGRYKLTPDAENDLEDIAHYTISEWGYDQAEKYAQLLSECFKKISSKQIIGRTFSSKLKSVQFTHCEHHYIFYQMQENKPVMILAVFHEKMDLMRRLRKRLS